MFKSGKYNGGPCNPGLAIVVSLLVIVLWIVLFILSGIFFIKNRSNKYPFIINICAL
jgi:hypothetical protein